MTTSDKENLEKFEEITKNADHHQREVLHSILERNSGVSYLQPYLRDRERPFNAEIYRAAVPLSRYEDYVPFINQIADGVNETDQPLLSLDPLICFFYSSGTSSVKPKLIPYFDSGAGPLIGLEASAGVFSKFFPPKSTTNKLLLFVYADIATVTSGGYEVMALSSYVFHKAKADGYKWSFISSPLEVIFGSNVEQQMYCHLLCSLRNFDLIDGIRAPYAKGLIDALTLLQSKWKQLSNDLENGFPDSEIPDISMRNSVEQVLGGPQPELSERIRSICGDQNNNWAGIVAKLWPNARYMSCISTGVMQCYYPKLKHYAGKLPIVGSEYAASECAVGINMDILQPPENTVYVITPTSAYFEFLPFNLDKNQTIGEETVDISGVEVGKMYEVVVTTYRGLYRYQLGDIVKVVGFHNSSPLIQYAIRAPKNPGEIITEGDLISAVGSFELFLKNEMDIEVDIIDFTSLLETSSDQKKLNIFVEFRDGNKWMKEERVVILKKGWFYIENGLGNLYKAVRGGGHVGQLVLSIVEEGTFYKLTKKAIENGASANQYKPPKIIRNPEVVDILQGSVLINI